MSRHERDLATGPVFGHLVAVAGPAALTLLFITLYNVTDTFFAGMVSAEAQAGLGVGSQIYFLVIAAGIGVRIGMAAVVGQRLGAGEDDEATRAASSGLALALALTVLAVPAGWFGLPLIIEAITAEGAYAALATSYVRWLLWAAPGFVLGQALAGLLTAQGDTVTLAWAQGGATLANVALNPLLIFGIPGLWDGLGLDGIALATVLCQTGVLLFVAPRALGSTVMARFDPATHAPRWAPTLEVLRQFVPASAALTVVVIGGAITQWLLAPFGDEAVAGYGVAFRLEQLLLLPVFGLCSAVLPLTSRNAGAGQPARVRQAFWMAVGTGVGLAGVGIAAVWTVGPWVVGRFSAGPEVADHALAYLRIESAVMVGFVLVAAVRNLLQGLERPLWPAAVGMLRQGLGVLAFGLLYTRVFDMGPRGVWWAIATSVGLGTLLSVAVGHAVARRSGVDLRPWAPADPAADG